MSAGPRIDVLTIFPELIEHFLGGSLLGQARREGTLDVRVTDLRAFATDRHHSVDDTPYGGGDGMVLRCEPVVAAVEAVRQPGGRVLALCPRGRRFDQALARELAGERQLVLLAGRYAGFDERIFQITGAEPLSIGDYVLSGGELAALVVTETVTRLIPGVLGNPESAQADSFSQPALEHPLFTRPREFRGLAVPEVLLSGDHGEIARWRAREGERVTRERRPDLLASNGVKR
ncbi:MAG TPA: tRNA (guanosine(37)-N1)-methyltransferase TrmD [Myxococcota bacterium]|nr:tRNA (guanosine(37)-N1)-methyltransferase TrmD [Myxococcota bacterium]